MLLNRLVIRRVIFCHKRNILPRVNSALHRKCMTRTKFALYQKCHHVSTILLPRKHICMYDMCMNYVTTKQLKLLLDQRGISQEVSLVTKKGVETKSYEGVSLVHILVV